MERYQSAPSVVVQSDNRFCILRARVLYIEKGNETIELLHDTIYNITGTSIV